MVSVAIGCNAGQRVGAWEVQPPTALHAPFSVSHRSVDGSRSSSMLKCGLIYGHSTYREGGGGTLRKGKAQRSEPKNTSPETEDLGAIVYHIDFLQKGSQDTRALGQAYSLRATLFCPLISAQSDILPLLSLSSDLLSSSKTPLSSRRRHAALIPLPSQITLIITAAVFVLAATLPSTLSIPLSRRPTRASLGLPPGALPRQST